MAPMFCDAAARMGLRHKQAIVSCRASLDSDSVVCLARLLLVAMVTRVVGGGWVIQILRLDGLFLDDTCKPLHGNAEKQSRISGIMDYETSCAYRFSPFFFSSFASPVSRQNAKLASLVRLCCPCMARLAQGAVVD